jgi:hypothetical protein
MANGRPAKRYGIGLTDAPAPAQARARPQSSLSNAGSLILPERPAFLGPSAEAPTARLSRLIASGLSGLAH